MPASLWAADEGKASWPVLRNDLSVEVAVVGAGYTGLSAALHLAEQGRAVAVIDGAEPGWGASGRNGGQVIPGLKYDPSELEDMYGPDLGHRLVATVGNAADAVFDLIERHRIDCAPVRSGWIQAAHSASALAIHERRARDWRMRGVGARVLSAKDVGPLTGSARYIGGWLDPRGGTVQPLLYVRGLAQAAVAAGASIFAGSPATALRSESGRWHLTTPAGRISADRVILATNAYTGDLWPGLRRTVVPVFSLQGATAPLDGEAARTILPGGQSVSDSFRLLRYFRRSPDGRLVMGTRGPFTDRPGSRHEARIARAITDIYPGLGGVRIVHLWTGRVAMTEDHVPHLHELAPGLLAALGYNGRGVAMATVLGRLLAQRAGGTEWDGIDYPHGPLKPIRFHAFNRLGVMAYANAYRLMDRFMP